VCAVTGVTGYVGGRLVPELLAAGHSVRAVSRRVARLDGRPWRAEVEVAEADVSDLEQTRTALEGVDVAFSLVHSFGTGPRFEARTAAPP